MEYTPTPSPDLTQNDFWPFPKIKSALKGQRFHTEGIQKKKKKNMSTALKAVP
jgi:hypothetical protein